jgi:hypothetical protein
MFRRSLDYSEAMTGRRRMRQARLRGLRHRLLPRVGEEGGWSFAAAVSFGSGSIGSIPCTLDQNKRSGRYAEVERVEEGQKETAASPGGAEIGRRCPQTCGDPTRNSVGLRWFLRGRGKRGEGGEAGLFIAGFFRGEEARVARGEAMDGGGASG